MSDPAEDADAEAERELIPPICDDIVIPDWLSRGIKAFVGELARAWADTHGEMNMTWIRTQIRTAANHNQSTDPPDSEHAVRSDDQN